MYEAQRRWLMVTVGGFALGAGAAAQISTTPLTFPGMTKVGYSSAPITVSVTAQSAGTIDSLVFLTGGAAVHAVGQCAGDHPGYPSARDHPCQYRIREALHGHYSLGCPGLPSSATCTFTPTQLALAANGTATASLLVDTGNPLGAGSSTSALPALGRGAFLCWLPLGLLAGLLRSKQGREARRKLGMLLIFAIAITPAIGISGCSGLSITGTAPGTYTIKLVGTGQNSGITQTQTITLVVTQ
jgi:hypothetical protein